MSEPKDTGGAEMMQCRICRGSCRHAETPEPTPGDVARGISGSVRHDCGRHGCDLQARIEAALTTERAKREALLRACQFVLDHPYAARGMGDPPHAQWREMRELCQQAIAAARGRA